MTTPEITRIRAALATYEGTDKSDDACIYLGSNEMTAVLAHIDAQAAIRDNHAKTIEKQQAEIERLRAEIEKLRDENSLAIANACAAHDDAERYRYLAPRLLAADFDWNETGKCVLVFDWPSNVGVGGNCDENVDAAIDAMKGSTP